MSPIDKINRSVTDALTNNTKTRAKSATTESTSQSNRPASEDTVSLSEQSLQVRELQQQLDKIPEVDADKVKAIKQAIAQGNYPLDPAKIAANLLNLEKALSE
jgi:negative regulator of flagellin synthesis FlgM